MSVATAAARPPLAGAARATRSQHTIHAAVTGTSLIGWKAWYRNVGDVATSVAAISAATPPPNRQARAPVAHTATPVLRTTTSTAPVVPATACGSAISQGSPGA